MSVHNFDAAQAIAAAAAQIELAVREVQPAVEELGALIANMSTGVGELRAAPARDADPEAIGVFPDPTRQSLERLEKHLHGGITQLQFYDRLVQHLGHVQDYLSGVASQLAGGAVDDDGVWMELRSRLRVRLISAAQRELLDAVLPPPEGAGFNSQRARDEHASQGTIELF